MDKIENRSGYIHSIETYGTVDGPGIRYIVFMQGCPMRCLYCHNPDTWTPIGNSKEMTVEELMEDVVKYKSFMNASGGGITVSGGEPLMQADFVTELFKACHKEGIHTALDTSGGIHLNISKKVLEYTDLLILDIKSINPETFLKVTSVKIDNTLKMAEYASENNIKMLIRFVLVPDLTDDMEDIRKLAEYIKTLNSVELVEILPFHKMGEYKWEELGLYYTLKDTQEPSEKLVKEAIDIFKEVGVNVR